MAGQYLADQLGAEEVQDRFVVPTPYGPTPAEPSLTPRHRHPSLRIATPADAEWRIGVIHNVRARHNATRHLPLELAGCTHAVPRSHDEMEEVLARFAAEGINALVIDGGDGTVRDIISAAAQHFTGVFPRVAIIPSGKTNALALDLGVPHHWTVADAVEAIQLGGVKERAPIEIWRPGDVGTRLRGFIFGAGAFVRATGLAQTTHRFGAFNGLAVALSIAGAVGQSVFGGRDNSWRQGEPMRVDIAGEDLVNRAQYMLLGSTLAHMPLKIKPFGRLRGGLKMLRVDAQPKRILAALPSILRGQDDAWLAEHGYHRVDAERIELTLASDFILDGETFAGGEMTLRQGAPMRFVVP